MAKRSPARPLPGVLEAGICALIEDERDAAAVKDEGMEAAVTESEASADDGHS
jgi:hypothetical protein